MKTISLPIYDIVVHIDDTNPERLGGYVSSSLYSVEDARTASKSFIAALDAVESFILACACNNIDIQTPAFVNSIQTVVDAIVNNLE